MADSCSLTRRLSVSRRTGTAALPLCVHTLARKHTEKYTQSDTHTHRLHLGPLRPCGAKADPVFPPDSMSRGCVYALTAPTGGKRPSLNMEATARCKFSTQEEQKVQKTETETAADIHFPRAFKVVLKSRPPHFHSQTL